MDYKSRYELMQRLENNPPLPEDWVPRKTEIAGYDMIGIIIFTTGIVLGLTMLVKSCTREPMPAVVKQSHSACVACHHESRHSRMTAYFRKAKHPDDPAKLATAVLRTEFPKTLAAIAVAENSPATSKRGGHRKKHAGVFQMSRSNFKAYGKTPPDINGQAQQAAALLRDLLAEEKTLPLAVARYAGEKTTDRYSRFVMAEIARNVP